MLKIGDSNIKDLKLGTTGVIKAYLGEIQVWPSGSPTPTQPYVRMGAGYLDTGIVPTANTKIEYVGYASQVAPVFGSGKLLLNGDAFDSNGIFFVGGMLGTTEAGFYGFSDMCGWVEANPTNGHSGTNFMWPNIHNITISKDGYYLDGAKMAPTWNTDGTHNQDPDTDRFEANGTIWLGSEANLDTNLTINGASCVSSFKIWEGDELIFHIEAKDSKHFYDRINGTEIDRYWKAPQPSFFSIKEFPEEELGISGVTGVYDTGYVAGPNTRVDIYFRPTTEHSDWGGVIGAQNSDDDNSTFQIRYSALSPELIARIGSSVTDGSFNPEEGKVYVATLDSKYAEGWTPTNNTLFLNAIHNEEWADSGYRNSQNEIFLVYIFENDEIVQAFYSDGEGHLLDMEENVIEPLFGGEGGGEEEEVNYTLLENGKLIEKDGWEFHLLNDHGGQEIMEKSPNTADIMDLNWSDHIDLVWSGTEGHSVELGGRGYTAEGGFNRFNMDGGTNVDLNSLYVSALKITPNPDDSPYLTIVVDGFEFWYDMYDWR